MQTFIDLFLHLDTLMPQVAAQYGPWIYALLFVIIFAETGLVVTPILPGDSLLFAAGAMAGLGALDPWLALAVLFAAAVSGDAVNYSIGRVIGPRIFHASDQRGWFHKLLNRQHLERAHAFFEQYGGKAVVLGRFVPIVRTFVPFVAGAAQMTRATFVFYNFTGGAAWVVLCFGAGYLLGGIPFIQKNFSLVTIGIVFVSVLPMVVEYLRHRRRGSS